MGRTLVEEVATLASLALFLGMVAIWAQVIATLSHRGRHEFRGLGLRSTMLGTNRLRNRRS